MQIAAQGATVDITDSVMTNNLQALGTIPVSYTHLDVYKRQPSPCSGDSSGLILAPFFATTSA